MHNQFGGQWTEDKLDRIRDYLISYLQIMHGNEKARYFRTVYFDAFAGSGSRQVKENPASTNLSLFGSDDLRDMHGLQRGSAELALDIDPGFDQYILIEQDREKALLLNDAIEKFRKRGKKAIIRADEANQIISRWCENTDWSATRCVMFLDPFGLQVEWETMKSIAQTKGIDLWILFPLGQAVNRMLTKNSLPPETWSNRLTRLFGTDEWIKQFYEPMHTDDMFGGNKIEKRADFEMIKTFFINRLRTIFPHVAQNPLTLRNSRNNPLFLLCFAAGNDKGGKPALRIANHLLKA